MPKHLPKPSEDGKIEIMALELDFDTWLALGMELGFCGPAVCYTHDGLPMSDNEWMEEDVSGEPPCMHIIRLYEDEEHRLEIEDAHSPSVWRKPRD